MMNVLRKLQYTIHQIADINTCARRLHADDTCLQTLLQIFFFKKILLHFLFIVWICISGGDRVAERVQADDGFLAEGLGPIFYICLAVIRSKEVKLARSSQQSCQGKFVSSAYI